MKFRVRLPVGSGAADRNTELRAAPTIDYTVRLARSCASADDEAVPIRKDALEDHRATLQQYWDDHDKSNGPHSPGPRSRKSLIVDILFWAFVVVGSIIGGVVAIEVLFFFAPN